MDYEVTADGLERLKAEIEELETTGRADMAAQIKVARGFGDLKENAEYHAAKEAQGHLETRILRLRERLNNAVVVEAARSGQVAFGSTVALRDEDSGAEKTWTLVSSLEADPRAGKLSMDSPVAQALRGKREGEIAKVQTPRGARAYRVVSVT
jgi:transcription elongation factor GreA